MINDMKEEPGTKESEVVRNQKPGSLEHQIGTEEFDLAPLPEREDFHWFSSSNNDISLTTLRNSVFLARRVRHPHKSVQVMDTGHVIIPSGRKTNSVTFAPSSSLLDDSDDGEEPETSSTSTDDRKVPVDKNCNCTHAIDCSRNVTHNSGTTRPTPLHFTCNNFRDSNDKRGRRGHSAEPKPLNSQRRSVSLPEKVWNELVNRSRKRRSAKQHKLGVSNTSASGSTSARSSISPAPTFIEMESESRMVSSEKNPGIRSLSHSRSTSSSSISNVQDSRRSGTTLKKIENVSDVTNGETVRTNETQTQGKESNGGSEKKKHKEDGNTHTKWKFFSKGFKRSKSTGANARISVGAVDSGDSAQVSLLQRSGSGSASGSSNASKKSNDSFRKSKSDFSQRKARPKTLAGTDAGAMANFFRSFRVKKNKVGNGKPVVSEEKPKVTTVEAVESEPSDFANRRRTGVNTSIFSSFYQAGRKHFSPKDLDDVTLDLRSGELMKTNDGTVIEKSDVVDVVTATNEMPKKKETKQKTKLKKKKKNVLVVAVAMTLPPSSKVSKSPSLSPAPGSTTGTEESVTGESNSKGNNTTSDYSDLYARAETKQNATCEILSSSNGGDSSTCSTSSSSRGSQTEHFPQQHLQEQNQHLRRLSENQEETENSFTQTKSLFGKVKELGSKSRRRFSHKTSSGSLLNSSSGLGNDSPQPSSLNLNNFDEVRKSSGEGNGDGKEGGLEASASNEIPTYRNKAVDIIGTGEGTGFRNSSEEESLASISNSQSGGFGSLSLSETEEYMGPFVGRAIATVDCQPSPYDRHALRYKKGDLIEIISKKPTGLWTGKVNGQVGHFKFINVEILPDESDDVSDEDQTSNAYERSGDHRSRQPAHYLHVRRRNKRMAAMTPWEMEQRQTVANVINGIRKENAALSQHPHSKSLDSESPFRAVQSRTGRRKSSATAAAVSLKKERPKSVDGLLRRINLEEYISVFILHGFESLDLFKELEEEDLDRLAILNQQDRAKILTIVELLREFDSEAEIPPIIIPTYSCPSQLDVEGEEDDRGSDLHRIIAPPPNFTRSSGAGTKSTTMVRDSGVFVKCDDQEDPEIEEIILSPVNLRVDMSPNRTFDFPGASTTNPSIFLGRLTNSGNGKQFLPHSKSSNSESYEMTSTKSTELWPDSTDQSCAVRQRFLQAKSLFETGITSPGGTSQGQDSTGQNQNQKNRFLFCEKSSDSGISVGANSPPPLRID